MWALGEARLHAAPPDRSRPPGPALLRRVGRPGRAADAAVDAASGLPRAGPPGGRGWRGHPGALSRFGRLGRRAMDAAGQRHREQGAHRRGPRPPGHGAGPSQARRVGADQQPGHDQAQRRPGRLLPRPVQLDDLEQADVQSAPAAATRPPRRAHRQYEGGGGREGERRGLGRRKGGRREAGRGRAQGWGHGPRQRGEGPRAGAPSRR